MVKQLPNMCEGPEFNPQLRKWKLAWREQEEKDMEKHDDAGLYYHL